MFAKNFENPALSLVAGAPVVVVVIVVPAPASDDAPGDVPEDAPRPVAGAAAADSAIYSYCTFLCDRIPQNISYFKSK